MIVILGASNCFERGGERVANDTNVNNYCFVEQDDIRIYTHAWTFATTGEWRKAGASAAGEPSHRGLESKTGSRRR